MIEENNELKNILEAHHNHMPKILYIYSETLDENELFSTSQQNPPAQARPPE